MRFPLNEQKVIGYDYGVPTSYSPRHLGVDWKADYVPLYAPKNGKILNVLFGPEGGNTLWFQPTGESVIIRWLHLSMFLVSKGQQVREGQQVAITGNTGHSDLSHLHEDIWKSKVTLLFKDTLNPHEYYKGDPMLVCKFDDSPTVYVLADDATLIGVTGGGLPKVLAGRPQKLVTLPASQRSNFIISTGVIN